MFFYRSVPTLSSVLIFLSLLTLSSEYALSKVSFSFCGHHMKTSTPAFLEESAHTRTTIEDPHYLVFNPPYMNLQAFNLITLKTKKKKKSLHVNTCHKNTSHLEGSCRRQLSSWFTSLVQLVWVWLARSWASLNARRVSSSSSVRDLVLTAERWALHTQCVHTQKNTKKNPLALELRYLAPKK